MLSEVDETFKYYFGLHTNETLNRLEQTPKLVIAALNGHAVGGGLEIALACDIRIARRGEGKIGLPEANLGLMPGSGGTQRAARLMGKARALQFMVESENLDYDRALELGLVNYAWDAGSREEFQAKVVEYARRFLPPDKASLAIGRIKRAVQSGPEMGFEQALALERELQAELWASRDAKEGIKAYVEKRKPKFSAR
jgi:enoyl-CoA hydratase/carnithine racemase